MALRFGPAGNNNWLLRLIAGAFWNADGTPANANPAGLPYGADNYTVAYYGTTNNPQTITYKKGSTTLKTRTLTYIGNGAADNDKLLTSIDS